MLERLDQQLKAAGLPISGVGIALDGSFDVRGTLTPAQRTAAQAIIAAFDPSDAAQTAWEEGQQPERKALRSAAAQAIQGNDDYLALVTPTAAQVAAQVRRLTQQNSAIIRRLIQIQ